MPLGSASRCQNRRKIHQLNEAVTSHVHMAPTTLPVAGRTVDNERLVHRIDSIKRKRAFGRAGNLANRGLPLW